MMPGASFVNRWQKHARGYALLVLLLIVSSPTAAQEGASNSEQNVRPVLSLSLKEAIALALAPEGDVRVRLAEQQLRRMQAQRDEVRAALLPHVEASLQEQNRTVNLEALGIRIPFPGFRPFVGPFTTFDLRAKSRKRFSISALCVACTQRARA